MLSFLFFFLLTKNSDIHLCGSILGGLVVLLDVGGLVLLLYIDHSATRDISNAFNVSARMQSGLCGPTNCELKLILIDFSHKLIRKSGFNKYKKALTCSLFWLMQ